MTTAISARRELLNPSLQKVREFGLPKDGASLKVQAVLVHF
jgi:hypothetical protein